MWVIDPSGSMNQHQTRLLAGIDAMMQALPASGWRLAIIPSDWRFAEQEATVSTCSRGHLSNG